MKISHVIRGEEHIPNTPKQILIAEALSIKTPKYLHLSLILGPDRSKLSKRYGAKPLLDYKKEGYLPEAMVNFLAFLGWNPGTEKEIFPMPSLIQEFSLDKIQKSGAVFNSKKLDWLNGFYIRQKPLNKLTELCIPYLIESALIVPLWGQKEFAPLRYHPFGITDYKIAETEEKINFAFLEKIVGLYQERLKKLSEITELVDFFFKDKLDFPKELLKWKDIQDKDLKDVLDNLKKTLSKLKESNWTKAGIEKALMAEAEKIKPPEKSPTGAKVGLPTEVPTGTKVGDRGYFLWPLRVALTGKKASAPPFDIAEILGKEKTLKRIKEARKKL